MKITLPHRFQPRPYQLPVFKALDGGTMRAVCIWHRRSGKDKTALNFVIKRMFERVGQYYYFFPTYRMGKKILWDGIDNAGMKLLDHFPDELTVSKNETEMKIKTINGSLFQIVGSDNFNTIVGPNPVGCVFSEYSLQDPRAWGFVRPIFTENKGWAIFLYTPRGRNHGFDLYLMAKDNPSWFCEILTVKDTKTISEADIEEERRAGMDEELIQQEFFCSFFGAVSGAYYARQLESARKENRITNVPWIPQIPIDTWWDLGIDDSMTIWFTQHAGQEIRVIDYYEHSGEGFAHYAKVLKEKPYVYGSFNFPFDIEVRELGTGKSRKETALSLNLRPLNVLPKLGIEDGIEAARNILSRCWFDENRCKRGIEALENYHREYDEKNKCFKSQPVHDWSSHGADAFRYFAVGFRERVPKRVHKREQRTWMTV